MQTSPAPPTAELLELVPLGDPFGPLDSDDIEWLQAHALPTARVEAEPEVDAFLRRVVEQRELEQEQVVLESKLEQFLPQSCRICGTKVTAGSLTDSLGAPTVCSRCGGRKRQAELEREDQVRARAGRRRQWLVGFVYPTQEAVMAENGPPCSVCGKPIRTGNTRGAHSACLAGSAPKSALAAVDGEAPPKTLKQRRSKDTKKRFRVLTEALGFNADELLEDFMGGWIDRIRARVEPPSESLRAVNE